MADRLELLRHVKAERELMLRAIPKLCDAADSNEEVLGRQIIADYMDDEGRLTVLTVDPRIEEKVAGSLQQTTTGTIPVLSRPSRFR